MQSQIKSLGERFGVSGRLSGFGFVVPVFVAGEPVGDVPW
jgi:hypothetical protein